jgi:site-specific recombinase XerD
MPAARPQLPPADLDLLHSTWLLQLSAEGKQPKTRRSYGDAVKSFAKYAESQGWEPDLGALTRPHIIEWETYLQRTSRPSSAATRHRGLLQFCNWLVAEGELDQSPMLGLRPPSIPETVMPMPTPDDIRKLLRACEGTRFEDRRDLALVTIFFDTGARLSEIAYLEMADLDTEHRQIRVVGKGRRGRNLSMGDKSALALSRYLRLRRGHPRASLSNLWLGHRGKMTDSGVSDAIKTRAKAAGLTGFHVYMFRHYFADHWLAKGGNETDLMSFAGWRSRAMVQRYAAARASDRAREAHKFLSPADDL